MYLSEGTNFYSGVELKIIKSCYYGALPIHLHGHFDVRLSFSHGACSSLGSDKKEKSLLVTVRKKMFVTGA